MSMIEGIRRRFLGTLRAPRIAQLIEQPIGTAPSLILHRVGVEWRVAMLHGGRTIHEYTPAQARRMATRFIEMAQLASNPGSCPTGEYE